MAEKKLEDILQEYFTSKANEKMGVGTEQQKTEGVPVRQTSEDLPIKIVAMMREIFDIKNPTLEKDEKLLDLHKWTKEAFGPMSRDGLKLLMVALQSRIGKGVLGDNPLDNIYNWIRIFQRPNLFYKKKKK